MSVGALSRRVPGEEAAVFYLFKAAFLASLLSAMIIAIDSSAARTRFMTSGSGAVNLMQNVPAGVKRCLLLHAFSFTLVPSDRFLLRPLWGGE